MDFYISIKILVLPIVIIQTLINIVVSGTRGIGYWLQWEVWLNHISWICRELLGVHQLCTQSLPQSLHLRSLGSIHASSAQANKENSPKWGLIDLWCTNPPKRGNCSSLIFAVLSTPSTHLVWIRLLPWSSGRFHWMIVTRLTQPLQLMVWVG